MNYSISQIAQHFDLKAHTLRYYEKEGILTPQKTEKGIRFFSQQDMDQLSMVCCLRSTGMSIKDIRRYFDLCAAGDTTTDNRLQIFLNHREHILEEISCLQKHLTKINSKIKNYSEAVIESI